MNYLKYGILFAVAVLFFGCIGGTPSTEGGSSTGGNGATGGSTAWCTAGSSWNYGGAGAEGQAQTVIKGMETYKGKQYCHVTTSGSSEGQTYKIDYYFIEDATGETTDMWMVMDYGNGQVYEQHVTQ